MKTLSVMQPTYIPWSGYFNLIKKSDIFVFFDDVAFEKQSWQTRNRILINGSDSFLSIPVKKSPLGTLISEIEVNDTMNWRKKHISSMNQAYAKSPFKDEIIPKITKILADKTIVKLSEINMCIIKEICDLLDINTKVERSSELPVSGKRTDYLIDLCKYYKADCYLSPVGSKEYLVEDDFDGKSESKLIFQKFNPGEYTQFKADTFFSHLSVIDVICNIGIDNTKRYILGE